MLSLRIPTLLVLSTIFCSCTATRPVVPEGQWRVHGGSNAFIQETNGGDFGDSTSYGAELSVGRFIGYGLLVEVSGGVRNEEVEDDPLAGGADYDINEQTLLFGLRYYFDPEHHISPYVGIRGGWRRSSVDASEIDPSFDDDDTNGLWQAQLGFESYLTPNVAIDLGIRYEQVYDLDLLGQESDPRSISGVVGLSVWF